MRSVPATAALHHQSPWPRPVKSFVRFSCQIPATPASSSAGSIASSGASTPKLMAEGARRNLTSKNTASQLAAAFH